MSIFDEIPMDSPHPKAKLFRRFSYVKDIVISEIPIESQLNNYVNFEKIKWVFETKTEKGQYQPITNLISSSTEFRIRTNSLIKIEQEDIVFLKHPLWGKGQYFLITAPVEIEYAYCPKPRLKLQHLALKMIDFAEIKKGLFKQKAGG